MAQVSALKECSKILDEFWEMPDSDPFKEPVKWKEWELFDYPEIIKHPMDMGTVRKKMEKQQYSTPQEFAKDMRLIWKNCMVYNQDGSDFYLIAEKLSKTFDKKMKSIAPAVSTEAEEVTPEPTLDEKTQFSQNIYKITSEDLGHVVQMLDRRCPTSLDKTSQDEIEINIDAIDGKSFKAVDSFVRSKLSTTSDGSVLSKNSKKGKKKKGEENSKIKRQKT